MDAATWVGLAGVITALGGAVAGIVAVLAKRRTEVESAEAEEERVRREAAELAQQRIADERTALTAEYRGLLDEMRQHHTGQERRYMEEMARLDSRLASIETALDSARAQHARCEENLEMEREEREVLEVRLRNAEQRLAEIDR